MRIKLISALVLIATTLMGCNRHQESFQGYAEGEYTYLASGVSGNLTQLLIDRGDRVITGQPLFILDPQPETAKLEQAKFNLNQATQHLYDLQKGERSTVIASYDAQLAEANAALDFNKKMLTRYEELYRQKVASKATYDEAKANYDQARQKVNDFTAKLAEAKLGARENTIAAQQAQVSADEAAVKQAEWALLQKSIRAPENSFVFDALYQTGEFITAGQPVVVLLPPNKIKFILFVPEHSLSKIKIGNLATISCDGCKKKYSATISYVSPSAEFAPPVLFSKDSRDKLVYRIEAKPRLEDAEDFHPGQPIDVELL